MISIKEAAQKAVEFCQQLFPNAQDFLLEEVERDENDKFWLITVSYLAPAAKRALSAMAEQFLPQFDRHFKSLKINAQTGEIISMKIRTLQP